MCKGAVIWVSGLAGSGKTTISRSIYNKLKLTYDNIIYLDGDEFRDLLGDYGYDKESRIQSARQRAKFANMLSNQGLIVITSAIALFNDVYSYNRENLKRYIEIYVECDIEELKRRDQKGIYSSFASGGMRHVVGMDIDFDIPTPHIKIGNSKKENLESKRDYAIAYITKILNAY